MVPKVYLAIAATVLCGCAENVVPPEKAYDPVKYQGQVDAKLPADAQEQQAALKSVLDQIQRGNDWENLYHPGVTFEETEATFWEGNSGLESWIFEGAPSDTDVAVALRMRNEKDELVTKKRRYRVSGSRGAFSILRAQ